MLLWNDKDQWTFVAKATVEEEEAATRLQALARGFRTRLPARQSRAATAIQKVFRGKTAFRRAQLRAAQQKAAVRIQCLHRKSVAQRRLRGERAAVRLQAVCRGRRERLNECNQWHIRCTRVAAAVVLQRHYLGFRSRKRIAAQREATAKGLEGIWRHMQGRRYILSANPSNRFTLYLSDLSDGQSICVCLHLVCGCIGLKRVGRVLYGLDCCHLYVSGVSHD